MHLAALALMTAAGWSPTQSFDAGPVHEPAPRVAIDARGHALLAYETGKGRLVASVRRKGRFARPVTLARRIHDHAVAPGAVAWVAEDGVHVATRTAAGFKARRVARGTDGRIDGVSIAADPQGGWVVAERRFARRAHRVRALSLDAAGRAVGAPQELGPGHFGLDARPTQALAVLADGRAVLTFKRGDAHSEPVVYAVRPHGGAFSEPAAVGERLADPRVTVAGDRAVLTATAVTRCGESRCAGHPQAFPLNPDGSLGAPEGPALAQPTRAFGPWAAPGAIVFQLKTGPQPFSAQAPVHAAALRPDAPLQTLTRKPATEPVALALSGDRTLAVWATRSRLGAALAGPDGDFDPVSAPAGTPPEPNHSNATNRDARSAGAYAVVAWSAGRTVNVSVRRF
jgi:hypothetical protein